MRNSNTLNLESDGSHTVDTQFAFVLMLLEHGLKYAARAGRRQRLAGLAGLAGGSQESTKPVLRGTCARDGGRFNIRQEAPVRPITNPLTLAARDSPPVSLAAARVNRLGPAQVTCELTGDVDAHPVAYRVSDVYNKGDGLDFTNADLGYPIVPYTNPLTGGQIPKWGWGYSDFTVSAWFRGSYWGDVRQIVVASPY